MTGDEQGARPSPTVVKVAIFAALWVVMSGYLVIYFLLSGAAQMLVGAKPYERFELFEMASYPLAWANPRFYITSHTSFLAMCGIISANSYFYTVLLFVAWRSVRAVLNRNRPTRLDLGGTSQPDEDDEL
jgi:hypothetical protein